MFIKHIEAGLPFFVPSLIKVIINTRIKKDKKVQINLVY